MVQIIINKNINSNLSFTFDTYEKSSHFLLNLHEHHILCFSGDYH
jgi:hypothetical protein